MNKPNRKNPIFTAKKRRERNANIEAVAIGVVIAIIICLVFIR